MKSSKYYQRILQVTGRGGDILLFLCGLFLGKSEIFTALIFLVLRLVLGYISSELVYRRLKAVMNEKGGYDEKV